MWPFSILFQKTEKLIYPNLKEIEAQYTAHKPRMFPLKHLGEQQGFKICDHVMEICDNGKGRLGFVLARKWQSAAVKEINQDGQLSKKEVYWTNVSWNACKPRRFAVVRSALAKNVSSILSSGSQILCMPMGIIEMDTWHIPEMSLSEWKTLMMHQSDPRL